jgi:hypothetical protein
MQNDEVLSDDAIEAATDNIVKDYETGKFLHSQIVCPNGDDAHKAFRSFRKKVQIKTLPTDIIIDCSEDKLTEIKNDPKYEALRITGVDQVFALGIGAALYDNAERLGTTSEAIIKYLSGEGKFMPGMVHEFLCRLVKKTPNTRALVVYDDFVNSIQFAEKNGFRAGYLPYCISRNLWDEMPDHQKFSMIGFTRPNDQTQHIIGRNFQTSNGFANDIGYLQQQRIQTFIR